MAEKLVKYEHLVYYDTKLKAWVGGGYVAKEAGKGLSANDYTDAEKEKLAGVAEGAQANVIEAVKVNGAALTPDGKAVDVAVPTKVSDLENDSSFATEADVAAAVAGARHLTMEKADSVPGVAEAASDVIYLVMNAATGHYDMYALVAGASGYAESESIEQAVAAYQESYSEDDLAALRAAIDAAGVADVYYKESEEGEYTPLLGEYAYGYDESDGSYELSTSFISGTRFYTRQAGEASVQLLDDTTVDLSGYVQASDLAYTSQDDIDALFASSGE